MAVLKTEFRETAKRKMPKRWFDKLPHTYVALDDARSALYPKNNAGLLAPCRPS